MKPSAVDLSLFTKTCDGGLSGITGSYVYNTLSAGNRDFEEESGITERKFESNSRVNSSITLAVIKINPSGDGFRMTQGTTLSSRYSNKLSLLSTC